MNDMLDPDHELTSDLEWMLQSGQVSQAELIETLMPEYAASVYRFALAWLAEAQAANLACRETFVRLALHVHAYRSQVGVRGWVYRQAVAACAFQARQTLPLAVEQDQLAAANSDPPSAEEQILRRLPPGQRQAILLREVAGLSNLEISFALNLTEKEISRLLKQGELAFDPQSNFKADGALHISDLGREPAFDPTNLPEQMAWVQSQAQQRGLRHQRSSRLQELLLVGVAIGAVILIFWAASQLSSDQPSQSAAAAPTSPARQVAYYITRPGDDPQNPLSPLAEATVESAEPPPTGVGQRVEIPLEVYSATLSQPAADLDLPRLPALSPRADSDTIRQRLEHSADLWRSLWLETEKLDYGPPGYIGPPVSSFAQTWVNQPDQSLELTGLLNGQINQVQLVTDGRQYRGGGGRSDLLVEPWSETDALVQDARTRSLIFPSTGAWMQVGGRFEGLESQRLAGRGTTVVDWFNPQGMRTYRLWLDARTGVVLRMQRFGADDGQLLLEDVIATQAKFDAQPPADEFDPHTAGLHGFARDELGQPLLYARSPVLAAETRPALPFLAPPYNLDRARSPLTFQFLADLQASALYSGTQTLPADLFAGGFSLGRIPFGLPWSLVCTRSPDGKRLAFATLPGGSKPGLIGWLNLDDTAQVYQPLPGFQAYQVAFGPDGRQLALFGTGGAAAPPGIYLLDLATSDLTPILRIDDARSLVWNAQGSHLAFLGKSDRRYSDSSVTVVNLATRQVVYQTAYDPLAAPNPEWPTADWGVSFPLSGDRYPCVLPAP